MKSKFQVGDRFAYIATGNTGTITNVNAMAGTVQANYDRSRGSLGDKTDGFHTLSEHLLRHALPGEVTVNQDQQPLSTPYPSEDRDTRTNQLLNELYHDRARLEGVVDNAVNLLTDIAETLVSADTLAKWLIERKGKETIIQANGPHTLSVERDALDQASRAIQFVADNA